MKLPSASMIMSEKTFLHLNHLIVTVDESVVRVHRDDGLDVVEDKVFFHCFSTEQWLQTGYMTGQNFVPGENMKKYFARSLEICSRISHSEIFCSTFFVILCTTC
jgi:hypothetical protein